MSDPTLALAKSPKRTMLFDVALALLVSLLHVQSLFAADPPEKLMDVKLVLSDSEILTNDGLAYKAIITNVSRSLITIGGPGVKPPYACVIEMKEAGEDWREFWNYTEIIKTLVPAPIQIPAGSTWAAYGQVFITNGKRHVFGRVGKSELRARINSPIGSYVSDAVSVDVKAWPKGNEPLDKLFQPYGWMVLDQKTIASQLRAKDFDTLCKQHPTGGVAKSLKMMRAVHLYVESGEVAGKAATWSEAFKALSVGLDEVRHDQLAFVLSYGAMKNEQWKDLEFLLKQVKDEGAYRRSMRGQLDIAIQTGKYRVP